MPFAQPISVVYVIKKSRFAHAFSFSQQHRFGMFTRDEVRWEENLMLRLYSLIMQQVFKRGWIFISPELWRKRSNAAKNVLKITCIGVSDPFPLKNAFNWQFSEKLIKNVFHLLGKLANRSITKFVLNYDLYQNKKMMRKFFFEKGRDEHFKLV